MKLIPISDRYGTYKATPSDVLASNFPVGIGTISSIKEPVYAVDWEGLTRKSPIVYVFEKQEYESYSGSTPRYCFRVAENEKMFFHARTSNTTIYRYDIPTKTQTAIYNFAEIRFTCEPILGFNPWQSLDNGKRAPGLPAARNSP